MDQFQIYHKDWQRDILYRAYCKAKRFPDLFESVQYKNDILKLDSKTYGLNNILRLPVHIDPAYTFTRRKGLMVAFFTKFSPLSNHYISPFNISGKTFNCAEQYLMFQKAMTFNDCETADKIMKEANPLMQKHLGREVIGFIRDQWMKKVRKVLLKGLKAKFDQNPYCNNFLDETKPKHIIEADKYDNIYGVGLSLFDPHLWDPKQHKGSNLMGLCLEIVRDRNNDPEIKVNMSSKIARYQSDVIMSNMTQTRFDIGDRKNASITEYRGVRYIHFQDKIKTFRKISFSSTEYFELLDKTDVIREAFAELNKKIKRRKAKKGKKSRSYEEADDTEDEEEFDHKPKRKIVYSDDSCDDETTFKGKKKKSKTHDFD